MVLRDSVRRQPPGAGLATKRGAAARSSKGLKTSSCMGPELVGSLHVYDKVVRLPVCGAAVTVVSAITSRLGHCRLALSYIGPGCNIESL